MTKTLLFSLFIVLGSCYIPKEKQIENKSNVKQKAEDSVVFVLDCISFSVSEEKLKTLNSDIDWYYPYQMLFEFSIINNSEQALFFALNDDFYSVDSALTYGKIECYYKGKRFTIGANVKRFVKPFSQKSFFGFNLDLPIFSKTYNRNEFNSFLNDFIKNAEFVYFPIKKDYVLYLKDNTVNYKYLDTTKILSEDIRCYFIHTYQMVDTLENIEVGYPLDEVPDSLVPFRPVPGIEY